MALALSMTIAVAVAAAPTYDSTKTPERLEDRPSANPYVAPDFESSASLADMMAWIKRTLDQYGTVKADDTRRAGGTS